MKATAIRHPTVVAATGLGLTVLVVLLMAAAPLYTDDFWWHLKAGEMYAHDGLWPERDWMLHTAHADAPVQHEWLFGWSLYHLHRLVGFGGLRIVHGLAVAAILALAYSTFRRAGRCGGRCAGRCGGAGAVFTCAAVGVFAVLSMSRLVQLRPDLFSIAATLVFYRLLLADGRPPGRMRIVAFAVLCAIWANVHSLFLLSANLLIAALLGVLLGHLLERFLVPPTKTDTDVRGEHESRKLAMQLSAALCLGVVAALLNPRGLGQHLTFGTSTESTAIWHVTDEWSHFNALSAGANHPSVTFARWLVIDVLLLGFTLTAGWRLVQVIRLRSAEAVRDFAPMHFGLALASIVAMFISIRFMWMLAFALLYLLHVADWRVWTRTTTTDRPVRRLAAPAATWLAAMVSVGLAVWFAMSLSFANLVARFGDDPTEYFTRAYRTHKFHLEGVHFLQAAALEGRLFNSYGMGGFLGYWLAPELRTFIDSRTEHYDASVFLDYSSVTQMLGPTAAESFLDVLDRHRVDVFFGIGFPNWWHPAYTTTHLEGVPGWLLVSRSFRHAIYLRNDARNRENLRRVASFYAAAGVPFDPERGLDPSSVIRERPAWAVDHAMLPPEHAELLAQASNADSPAHLDAANALGLVYLLTGAYDEQLARDRRTAAEYPDNVACRQRLAYTLMRLAQSAAAAAVVEALMRIDPDDRYTLALAEAARALERLGALADSGDLSEHARIAVRVHRNRVLWNVFPAPAIETWTVEHRMRTEALAL